MRDYWLMQAIRRCGSQQELARRMRVSREKITYLLNRSTHIGLQDALLIQVVTDGAIPWYRLADTVDPRIGKLLRGKVPLPKNQAVARLSQRVQQGLDCEATQASRRGQRTDLDPVDGSLRGRTLSHIVQQFGLGSDRSYLRAKRVVQRGIPALIEAMDQGQLSIFMASRIAQYKEVEQTTLLALSRSERSKRLKVLSQCPLKSYQPNPHVTPADLLRHGPTTPWSQRVAQGLAYEQAVGSRQGARTDLMTSPHTQTVRGRTTAYVADQLGFGSTRSYCRAQHVVLNGIPALIDAMDRGDVSMFAASEMASYEAEVQQQLLALTAAARSERLRELKQIKRVDANDHVLTD